MSRKFKPSIHIYVSVELKAAITQAAFKQGFATPAKYLLWLYEETLRKKGR